MRGTGAVGVDESGLTGLMVPPRRGGTGAGRRLRAVRDRERFQSDHSDGGSRCKASGARATSCLNTAAHTALSSSKRQSRDRKKPEALPGACETPGSRAGLGLVVSPRPAILGAAWTMGCLRGDAQSRTAVCKRGPRARPRGSVSFATSHYASHPVLSAAPMALSCAAVGLRSRSCRIVGPLTS